MLYEAGLRYWAIRHSWGCVWPNDTWVPRTGRSRACPDRTNAAAFWGVPLCDSSSGRGGFWLVEGTVAQHGEHHVAASSSERDERLIVALTLLDLARVIVP